MSRYLHLEGPWGRLLIVLLLISVSGCRSKRAAEPTAAIPAPTVTASTPAAIAIASITKTEPIPTIPVATPQATERPVLTLPTTFRYSVTLRQAKAENEPETIISGRYHDSAWAQTVRQAPVTSAAGEATDGEEWVSVEGLSYTRPVGQETWTRWPGTGFDAAYGLTSPFTALRLYPLATERTQGVLEPVQGAPEATFRIQTVVSGQAVAELLKAGIDALARGDEQRAAVDQQVAPLAVQQTITYWVGEDGRIYQAAATLLAVDDGGAPAPWLEITWRFWDYDDPSIVIAPPSAYRDAPGPETTEQPLPTAQPPSRADGDDNLTIRVYASAGIPADNLAVTVYPAGEARQPLDWRSDAEAGFTLPPGVYDVLVQMDYAQEWLRGLAVSDDAPVTRDVVFDFGTLELTITRDDVMVPVEVVTYPADDRQNWVDWRSDNPATIRLRAGVYDVEIAYADYTETEIVTGLVVKAGEVTEESVVLAP